MEKQILPRVTSHLNLIFRNIKISEQKGVNSVFVCVYDLIKKGSYKEIFLSFNNKDLSLLSFESIKQVKRFIKKSLVNFKLEEYKFHFLLKNKEGNYVIAYVNFFINGLNIDEFLFTSPIVLNVLNNHRFFVIQK